MRNSLKWTYHIIGRSIDLKVKSHTNRMNGSLTLKVKARVPFLSFAKRQVPFQVGSSWAKSTFPSINTEFIYSSADS